MAKAAKKNDITELKFQISENKLQKMYIFYGDEEYLKEFYIKKIEALVPDCGLAEYNRIVINGVQEYSVYDDVWEEMPVMTDRRLLVIRDSKCFCRIQADKQSSDKPRANCRSNCRNVLRG